MIKPLLDDFDRFVLTTNTYYGKSIRRKLNWLRIRKRVLTIIEKI